MIKEQLRAVGKILRVYIEKSVVGQAAHGGSALQEGFINVPRLVGATGEGKFFAVGRKAWIDCLALIRSPVILVASVKHLHRDSRRAAPAVHEGDFRPVRGNGNPVAHVIGP